MNNAVQMKRATESNGGIPGVRVKYVKIPQSSTDNMMVNWDGIGTLNNFQFEPNGIRVWKAYQIGLGKLVSWADVQSNGISPVEQEVLEPPAETQQSRFRIIKPRQEP